MFPTTDSHYVNNPADSVEEINMPIFIEQPPTIVEQPVHREQDLAFPGGRRPIPVSTIDWQTSQTSHFIPLSGAEFLREANQLIIQQTVELNDLISTLPSENRYVVKVPRGETIYYAIETSEDCERTCFGSSRSFSLRLYDATQQESLHLKRRLACGACCSLFCFLQELEVWIPPGELVGTIQQRFSATRPIFWVMNRHGELVYRIEGPDSFLGCPFGQKQNNFQIYSGDGATQLGSVVHQWDQVQVEYNLLLQFPGNIRDIRSKCLLLGGAFLLEYMYFENSKRRPCCRC